MTRCKEHIKDPIRPVAQLLVEGNDQKNFFEALTKFLGIEHSVQIRNFGGTQDLHGYLLTFRDMRGFDKDVKRIGIVRDAESDFTAAFSSVCSSFDNANLPAPVYHGTFTDSSPSVGVIILPGENQTGMLETLLCRTISECDINACINEFFECIKCKAGIHVRRVEKARARVFLTTRPDPHLSVGVAAKRGYWDLGHDEFKGVRDFLLELVSLDGN